MPISLKIEDFNSRIEIRLQHVNSQLTPHFLLRFPHFKTYTEPVAP